MTTFIQLSNLIALNKRFIMVMTLVIVLSALVAFFVLPEVVMAGPAPSPNYGCGC